MRQEANIVPVLLVPTQQTVEIQSEREKEKEREREERVVLANLRQAGCDSGGEENIQQVSTLISRKGIATEALPPPKCPKKIFRRFFI